MALDGAQFVKAVMEKLGAASPADLAEKMRWPRGTERLVAKWLAGTNQPSYRYVMEMIDKAELLDLNRAARPLTADERAAVDARRSEAEALLTRLLELMAL